MIRSKSSGLEWRDTFSETATHIPKPFAVWINDWIPCYENKTNVIREKNRTFLVGNKINYISIEVVLLYDGKCGTWAHGYWANEHVSQYTIVSCFLFLIFDAFYFTILFPAVSCSTRFIYWIFVMPHNSTRSVHFLRPKYDLLLLVGASWYRTFWQRRSAIRRNKKKPRDIIITIIIVGRISVSTGKNAQSAERREEADCESFCVFGFISFQYIPIRTDRKILKTNYVYASDVNSSTSCIHSQSTITYIRNYAIMYFVCY